MDKNNQACFKPAAKFHPSLYAGIKFVQTKLENCSVEVHTSLTFFFRGKDRFHSIPYTRNGRGVLFTVHNLYESFVTTRTECCLDVTVHFLNKFVNKEGVLVPTFHHTTML